MPIAKSTMINRHPSYENALKRWQLVQDCVDGDQAIKLAGVKYLPMPNPEDNSDENIARYSQYSERAIFYGATQRTFSGMVGATFRKPPTVELAPKIDYLMVNVDNSGLTLEQQARDTVGNVLMKGRQGLFVDMPTKFDIEVVEDVDGNVTEIQTPVFNLSQQDVDDGFRPTIQSYVADNILDWSEIKTMLGRKLNYVKLCENESVLDPATGTRDDVEQIRVLALNTAGEYYQEVFIDGESTGQTYPQANGEMLSYIPFIFCGAEDNKPDIDNAPLYDLAIQNVGHYRNSADFEEACFICGQPTLAVVSKFDPEDFRVANPNGVMIGSRKGHYLGEGGSLVMVQAEPNNLPKEAMTDKAQLMVSLGAQVITPTDTAETATAVNTKTENSTSALALAVGNVSDAYTKALGWCGEFMGETGDSSISLNTEFFPQPMNAQDMLAWSEMVQKGLLPDSTFYNAMRRAGNIADNITDKQLRDERSENGFGVNLDDNSDENTGGE